MSPAFVWTCYNPRSLLPGCSLQVPGSKLVSYLRRSYVWSPGLNLLRVSFCIDTLIFSTISYVFLILVQKLSYSQICREESLIARPDFDCELTRLHDP